LLCFLGTLLLLSGSRDGVDDVGNTDPAMLVKGFADLHNSVLVRLFDHQNLRGLEDQRYSVNLQSIKAVNGKLLFLSVGLPRFSLRHPDTLHIEHLLRFLKDFRQHSQQHYPELAFVPNRHSLQKALHTDKVAWAYALEGSHLLAGEVRWVDSLYEAGVRMIGIAHWFHNHFLMQPGDTLNASTGYQMVAPRFLETASVLSPKGRELVEYILEKDIILDVSHLPDSAFWQVVALNAARRPLVASHANAWDVCPVDRNLTEEQVRAIAASGGLIGVSLHRPMLRLDGEAASLADVADHLAVLCKLAGEDHVALGTDLEGRIQTPVDFHGLTDLKQLRPMLRERGLSESAVEKIFHQNVEKLL
jgi:membrane dipeptidase